MSIEDWTLAPPHVHALQEIVNRCPTLQDRKQLIVAAGSCSAISPDEAHLLITANLLENE